MKINVVTQVDSALWGVRLHRPDRREIIARGAKPGNEMHIAVDAELRKELRRQTLSAGSHRPARGGTHLVRWRVRLHVCPTARVSASLRPAGTLGFRSEARRRPLLGSHRVLRRMPDVACMRRG